MNQTGRADLEGYIAARRFAMSLSQEIAGKLNIGMTEKDAEEVASEIFRAHGVKQHWHMPIIGVGEGSTKLRSTYAIASSFLTKHKRVLQENDLVLIDIAPIYNGYPADYTTTHIFGSNPELEALAAYAHDISRRIAMHLERDMVVADVFRYAKELIRTTSNYTLALPPFIAMGHRICRIPPPWENFPEAGLTYLLLKTRGSFIAEGNCTRMDGLWVVEPYLMHSGRAAKFEVLVYVGEEPVIMDCK